MESINKPRADCHFQVGWVIGLFFPTGDCPRSCPVARLANLGFPSKCGGLTFVAVLDAAREKLCGSKGCGTCNDNQPHFRRFRFSLIGFVSRSRLYYHRAIGVGENYLWPKKFWAHIQIVLILPMTENFFILLPGNKQYVQL